MSTPPGFMSAADMHALFALGLAELERIECDAEARIAARIAAGEDALTVMCEERDRALGRLERLDAGVLAALEGHAPCH